MSEQELVIRVLEQGVGLGIWGPAHWHVDAASVQLELCDAQGQVLGDLSVAHATGDGHAVLQLPINPAALRRWSPADPYRYRVRGSVRVAGQSQAVDQRVGFRWFERQGDRLLLNGQAIYFRGCIRGIQAHDHPNFTGESDTAWHEKVIRAAKDFGFNLVRWHSTIPSEAYLEAADRLGICNQIEIGFRKKGQEIQVDGEGWVQMIQRVCRHPSVAIYCIGNEIRRAGSYPHLQDLVRQARQLDPSVLVTDSCGWGQPDRPEPDFYSQHVAYYYPFREHAAMFEKLEGFELEGFVTPDGQTPAGTATAPLRPTIAHEVCHYTALRDLDRLEGKWADHVQQAGLSGEAAQLPWWFAETRNLYAEKGWQAIEPELRAASQRFQAISQRHAIEKIRSSAVLHGFQMLQLIESWKYENSNALLDVFDDPIHWEAEAFHRFNGDTVLLADLPGRVVVAGDALRVPVRLSHFGAQALPAVRLRARWQGESIAEMSVAGPIAAGRLTELGALVLTVPAGAAQAVSLDLELEAADGSVLCQQAWDLWRLPDAGEENVWQEDRLIHDLDDAALARLRAGEALLWHYRPDYLLTAPIPPEARRPARDWDAAGNLWKPCIWDRGTFLGAVVREHPGLAAVPHAGQADWQFADLFHHSCKINLDTFPVAVRPIVQIVDRPARDRAVVMGGGSGEFLPEHTCRNWGAVFELQVGPGRLLVCGLNLQEAGAMGRHLAASLLASLAGAAPAGTPAISEVDLLAYLEAQAKQLPLQEPPMTQYWLEDNAPVEEMLFWERFGIRLK